VQLQLALSRTEVESLRVYDSIPALWIMVLRTAFTELRYLWVRLVGAVLSLVLMFLLPPLWLVGGLVWSVMDASGGIVAASAVCVGGPWCVDADGANLSACRPIFGLAENWVWTLPIAGLLYGAMTVDSALRYTTGMRIGWRDR
jgi:hypothetical protein